MKYQLYWNENTLPTKNDPQVIIYGVLPVIETWFVNLPIYIGINKGSEHWEFGFVLFGFGFILNHNWDN